MLQVKGFAFNPFYENTYILYDETQEAVIIDPGCFDDDEEGELKGFINQNSLQPVRLVNTHCHLDHILGNRFVSEEYQLPLEIHPDDRYNLDLADDFAAAFGVSNPNSPAPGAYLQEGSFLEFGNQALKILFTPGHSAGHIALYSQKDALVMSADVLFNGGIGRTDLPGGDYSTLMKTIQDQLLPLGDDVTVYPGHGPTTNIGHERRNNPFLLQEFRNG